VFLPLAPVPNLEIENACGQRALVPHWAPDAKTFTLQIFMNAGGGGCSGKHGGVRATRVWHGGVRGAAAAAAAAGKAARGRAAHGSAAAAAAQVRTRLRRGVKAVRGFRVGIERY